MSHVNRVNIVITMSAILTQLVFVIVFEKTEHALFTRPC